MKQDGKLEQVDPDEVAVGTIIVVQPGEKIPIDGIVTEGKTSLNTSALTGESLPREVAEGDEVISGCINMSGLIQHSDDKGVRRVHGIQDPGACGKFQFLKIPI